MRYRVKINQEKLNELKKQLQPGKSYWALIGIVIFFFVPEVVAYFWGDEIKEFFNLKAAHSSGALKYLYSKLTSLGENSYFNIALGVLFVVWFFKARKE